jgi:hypothetical protein
MLSDFEVRVLNSIEKDGWFGLSVSAGTDTPSFTYSIGFTETLKCPEFIVFGLDFDLMHSMLWQVFEQVRDGRCIPAEGARWSGVLDGCDCVSRAVHPSQIKRDYFNSAMWYRRHRGGRDEDLRAYQLFWPGKTQLLFPWENGCDEFVRDCQPLLYLPSETGIA